MIVPYDDLPNYVDRTANNKDIDDLFNILD